MLAFCVKSFKTLSIDTVADSMFRPIRGVCDWTVTRGFYGLDTDEVRALA